MQTLVILVGLVSLVGAKSFEGGSFPVDQDNVQRRHDGPVQRIVNGLPATPGQFPFHAVLIAQYASGDATLCGGSILTNNFILTADVCVRHNGILASEGQVIVGAHNRHELEPSQQRSMFSAAGVIVHPQFDWPSRRNDIAVVRLNTPVTFNDRVLPVRLPARSDVRQFGGLIGTVAGYGRTTAESGTLPDTPWYTTNPIMTNTQCSVRLPSVASQHICMMGDNLSAPCTNDQGGALIVDRDLQVGILTEVSYESCYQGMPSFFTRVSSFLDWIETNTDYIVAL